MRQASRIPVLSFAVLVAAAACSSSTGPSPLLTPSGAPASASTFATTPPPTTPVPTATPAPTPTPTSAPVRHQYLLYSASVNVSGGFLPSIWVVKADGTGRHKIADGFNEASVSPPTHMIDAAWSHDGSVVHVITYSVSSNASTFCTPTIKDYPIDGGAARTVAATLTNHDDNFIWSPDGTRIVFRHWTGQPNCVQDIVDPDTSLVMMNADGSNRHTIASGVTYAITAWTADGTGLIGVDPDTGRAVSVNPSNGTSTFIGPLAASYPAVSPDGTGVAFITSDRLHVANANGTGAIDLGATSATDFNPVWSQDGTAIAFVRTVGPTNKVVVVHLPSPTVTTLYSTTANLDPAMVWSPDSASVTFSLMDGAIVVAKADGSGSQALSGTSGGVVLSWQP